MLSGVKVGFRHSGVPGWWICLSVTTQTFVELLQNGVDGHPIHDALSGTSQSEVGDVTSLQGELIHKTVSGHGTLI